MVSLGHLWRFTEYALSELLVFLLYICFSEPDIVFSYLFMYLLKIALEKNFTRGRRSEQVQAACIYIACRWGIFQATGFIWLK